ncbi:hypothetical protein GGR52DRAFT_572513 [Hypoxylon sp. FL1284]|nr:hypothetical protein GGR52DRAFT_572513 [Hypoxylon sp. FL1284]
MSPFRDQLLKTAKGLLQGMCEFTPESVTRLGSDKCVYRIGPDSLGTPTLNNEQLRHFVVGLNSITPTFDIGPYEPEEILVDEVTRKVALRVRSFSPTIVGDYHNEYIFFITMSEDGKQIDDVLEYRDSLHSSDILPKMAKAIEEKAQEKAAAAK